MLQVVQSSALVNMSRSSRTKSATQLSSGTPTGSKSKELYIDSSLKIAPDKKKRLSSLSRERVRASFLSCAAGAKSPTSPAYGTTPFEFPEAVRKQQPNCLNVDPETTVMVATRLSDSDDSSSMTILDSLKAKLGHLDGNINLPLHSDNHLNNKPENGVNASNKLYTDNDTTVRQKPPIWKSISTFSLRTLSFRRKNTSASCNRDNGGESSTESNSRSSTMERSCNQLSNSVPGDEHLSLATISTDTVKSEKSETEYHRGRAQSISSQIGSSKSRRKSTDDGGSTKRLSTYASSDKAEVIYGTLRRRNTGRFVSSVDGKPSPSPLFKRELRRQGSSPTAEDMDSFTGGISRILNPSANNSVRLVRVLKLDKYLMNRWITGLSFTDKNDLVVVDLRAAYIVDLGGNLIRTIGTKGSNRLIEPIGAVALGSDGRLAFSDHADQCMKIYTSKGNHVLTERDLQLKNIASIAYNRDTDEIFIAGTDRKNVLIYRADGRTETIPQSHHAASPFQHPYSIAYNAASRDIIVGDDYSQSVTAVSRADGRVTWRFRPPVDDNESTRQFFPSAICVDQDGYVFVADLYNEKVYMLDVHGVYVQTLLTSSVGLRGNPGAMTTDGRGNLFVADEEKTVKIFQYRYSKSDEGESVDRTIPNRFSFGPETLQY